MGAKYYIQKIYWQVEVVENENDSLCTLATYPNE